MYGDTTESALDLYKLAKSYRAPMDDKLQALQTLSDMQSKDAREYLFKLANDGYVLEDIRHKALDLAIQMGKYLDGKMDLPMPKKS